MVERRLAPTLERESLRPMIPLARPFFDRAELDEVAKVLDSRWVAQGPKCKEFEDRFAAYIGAPYAVSLSSCTAALHLALLALGVGKGDDVLVSDFTFPATGNAVLHAGARPVFVDIQRDTYNLDPVDLEKKITPRSKAIILVHAFGNPADLDAVLAVAARHGLSVVEDAACAHGAKYAGRKVGTFGDVACFSFHARKNMTTGEGGMITTGRKDLADHVRKLATHGIDVAWNREDAREFTVPVFDEVGYNYRLSDIASAVGIAQLAKLDALIQTRTRLARYYDAKLKEPGFAVPQRALENATPIYQSYVVLLDADIPRNQLINRMRERGIQTTIGTYASHIQPAYGKTDACPTSLDVFNRTLALPLFYEMTERQVDQVVDALADCVSVLREQSH